ncbi:MAG: metallophosphoesterase, partial [Clostridiales bacterium]|nr:metallophosphoesterase [Clostridiales bacterium]
DYGNAHFIFLDSNLMGNAGYAPALTAWLENDLQNAETQAWKIVVQHHPYYPASESPKDEQRAETLRQFYLPILEAHGVDLILCGHQHAYTRTVPLLAGAAASGGVVQVMASSGVKHYIFEDYDYFAAGLGNTAVYVELNYDDNLFSLLAKDGEGRVVDEYEIRR